MNIVASNFIEVRITQYHSSNTKLGTDVSQKLVGVVQDSFGKDIDFYPIHRLFLYSTDDTTLFISPENWYTLQRQQDASFLSS